MTPNSGGRPLYVLPFRAAVAALCGVVLVGLVAGAAAGWLAARQLVKRTPTGEAVIARVEQVTVAAEEALGLAAAEASPGTALIVGERNRAFGIATAVTRDGVLVGAGSPPKGSLRVRFADQREVSASVVRVYPGFGLYFLRTEGTFPPAAIAATKPPLAGTQLAMVSVAATGGPRVRLTAVEAHDVLPGSGQEQFASLGRLPRLKDPLPPSFQGAPAVAADRRLHGLVLLAADTSFLVPARVLEVLTEDYLARQEGTTVRVLSGLSVRIAVDPQPGGASLVAHVVAVAPESPAAAAGIRRGDLITRLSGEPLAAEAPLALQFLSAAREGKSLPLTVRRDNRDETLEIRPVISAG